MSYYRAMNDYSFLKKLLLLCFLPVGFCALLLSCHDKKDHLEIDYKYGYAPMDTGKYIVYDVDSIFCYSTNFAIETVHYQQKIEVTDTFYDLLNEMNYKLTLYRRSDNSQPWDLEKVWSAKKTVTTFQVDEDNIRFINLIFPPDPDATWNGLAYVPAGPDPYGDFLNWDYHYENVDAPYTINGFPFDSSLTSVGVYDSNFIKHRIRKLVYGKNVGLISEDWGLRHKQTNERWDTARYWNGFIIHMRMIDHN